MLVLFYAPLSLLSHKIQWKKKFNGILFHLGIKIDQTASIMQTGIPLHSASTETTPLHDSKVYLGEYGLSIREGSES
jgi:hypothetical protein